MAPIDDKLFQEEMKSNIPTDASLSKTEGNSTSTTPVQLHSPLKKCVVCESSNIRFRFIKRQDGKEYSIWKCKKCGSGFLNPRPPQIFLEAIYSRSGHGLVKPVSLQEILSAEKSYPNSTIDAKRLVQGAYQLLKKRDPLNLVDIGSGYGFYSAMALSLGYSVVAVNPSVWENNVYEQMNGFRPIQLMFENVDFGDKKFETVIMSQVLEHIQQPKMMLEKVRELLSEGGIIAIAVPNINSFRTKIIGYRDNSCYWVPEHLNFFSYKGLRYLLEDVGFQIVDYTVVSRIPYTAFSKKFNLSGWSSAISNKLTRVGQVLPLILFDRLGFGLYHNFWAKKIAG